MAQSTVYNNTIYNDGPAYCLFMVQFTVMVQCTIYSTMHSVGELYIYGTMYNNGPVYCLSMI
jgi:hypothetical protein